MRKYYYYLLTAILALSGTAGASGHTSSAPLSSSSQLAVANNANDDISNLPFVPTTIINGKFAAGTTFYKMRIGTTRGGTIYYAGGNLLSVYIDKEDSTTVNNLWAFTGNLTDGFEIYNVTTGTARKLYIESSASGSPAMLGTPEEIAALSTNATSKFGLQPSSSYGGFVLFHPSDPNACLNVYNNNNILAVWNSTASPSDANSNITFIEPGEDFVIYKLAFEGSLISTKLLYVQEGSAYPKPFANGTYYTIKGYKPNTEIKKAGIDTVNLELVLNDGIELPFAISSSIDESVWTAMQVQTQDRENGPVWLATSSANSTVNLQYKNWVADPKSFYADYKDLPDNIRWCVTGDPYNGFRFYNRLKRQYLAKPTQANVLDVALNSSKTTVTTLELYYNPVSTAGSKWSLRFKGTDLFLTNLDGAYATLKIDRGEDNNKNNDCSAIGFIAEKNLPVLEAKNVPDIPPYSFNDNNEFVGWFNFPFARENKTEKGEALYDRYHVGIEKGTLYSIYYKWFDNNTTPSYRYLGSDYNIADTLGYIKAERLRLARERETDGSALSKLWTIEINEATGKYIIRNANTGSAIGKWMDSNSDMKLLPSNDNDLAEASSFDFKLGTVQNANYNYYTSWLISEQGHILNAYLDNQTRFVRTNDDPTDEKSNWFIKRVTSVPLTIYEDTQWASVTYPFGARLPAELTAYIVTAADAGSKSVSLSPIGQDIPAKTPVFVTLTSGSIWSDQSYVINIDNSIAPLERTNLLKGTTAARTGFDPSTLYVLTSTGDGGATLKLNGDVATVPANKAYLPLSAVAGGTANTQALRISIGDATGISNTPVGNRQDDNIYYDLDGRRVLYPAQGVYVKANGQKVYIK